MTISTLPPPAFTIPPPAVKHEKALLPLIEKSLDCLSQIDTDYTQRRSIALVLIEILQLDATLTNTTVNGISLDQQLNTFSKLLSLPQCPPGIITRFHDFAFSVPERLANLLESNPNLKNRLEDLLSPTSALDRYIPPTK